MRSDERHFYENQYPAPPKHNPVKRAFIAVGTALGALIFAALITDWAYQSPDVQAPGEQTILEYDDNGRTLSASE